MRNGYLMVDSISEGDSDTSLYVHHEGYELHVFSAWVIDADLKNLEDARDKELLEAAKVTSEALDYAYETRFENVWADNPNEDLVDKIRDILSEWDALKLAAWEKFNKAKEALA